MADAPTREVLRYEHPGAGRRRARDTPKGREVQPQAKHEVATLLGDRPRTREYLIEHPHLIQDTYHQLGAAHLAALADEMRLAYAEIYETATFPGFNWSSQHQPELIASARREPRQVSSNQASFVVCR